MVPSGVPNRIKEIKHLTISGQEFSDVILPSMLLYCTEESCDLYSFSNISKNHIINSY